MDVREKLVEILKQAPFEGKVLDEWWLEEKIKMIADYLIANGVTVQKWISAKRSFIAAILRAFLRWDVSSKKSIKTTM